MTRPPSGYWRVGGTGGEWGLVLAIILAMIVSAGLGGYIAGAIAGSTIAILCPGLGTF